MDRRSFVDHGRRSHCRRQKDLVKAKVMRAWGRLGGASLDDYCAEHAGDSGSAGAMRSGKRALTGVGHLHISRKERKRSNACPTGARRTPNGFCTTAIPKVRWAVFRSALRRSFARGCLCNTRPRHVHAPFSLGQATNCLIDAFSCPRDVATLEPDIAYPLALFALPYCHTGLALCRVNAS